MKWLRFLIISAVFSILNSCCSDPEVIYVEPDPPIIGDGIERPVLTDSEALGVDEYKMMIVIIRWEIKWLSVQETLKIIPTEEYQKGIDEKQSQIDAINSEIERLELLD